VEVVSEEEVVVVVALAVVPAEAVVPREVGKMIFTYTAILICLAIIAWYVLTYNALVKARNAVDQAWSHIEVELKRRLDLIQNLLETAKGYARYESDTFQKVTQLRSQANAFENAAAANKVEPDLHRTIGQIMVLSEDYPQLRADQSFLNLQTELANTENRIAERRHAYNQTVNVYRNLQESIPSNIVADIQEMPPRAFFDVPDEEVAQVPKVELS
jgi:LemA protein